MHACMYVEKNCHYFILSFFLCVVVTIGFEQSSYTFSEPPAGIREAEEPVCLSVTRGSVGTVLIVTVDWTPGTAFGESTLWIL